MTNSGSWVILIVCELHLELHSEWVTLVSYAMIMPFNTHMTIITLLFTSPVFSDENPLSGIVSSSMILTKTRQVLYSQLLSRSSLWTKVFFTLLWTNQKTCSETTASHHGVNWFNTTRNRNVFVSASSPLSRGCKNAITVGQCVFDVNKHHETFVENIA